MRTVRIYLLLTIMSFPAIAIAQLDVAMQQLTMTYQRSYTNPAMVPDVKLHLGLPVVSYGSASLANTGFKGKDIYHIEGDVMTISVNSFIDGLKDKNSISSALTTDLFTMAFKTRSGYFSLNVTEKFRSNFSYPKDIFEFVYYGNGAVLGEEMSFDFGLNVLEYSEIGIGYTQKFKEKLFIGAKAKYYIGRVSIQTNEAFFNITTAEDDFTLTATSNVDINSSFHKIGDEVEFTSVMTGNRGFGFDAGAVYKMNDKLQFSASIIDVGSIKWVDNVVNHTSRNKDAQFVYSGMDLNSFFSDSTSFEEDMQVMTDSLFRLFEIDETYIAYKQTMPMQAYLGAKFTFNKHLAAGATLFAEKYKKDLYPGISIYGQGKFGKVMDLVVSYSIYRNSYTNIGLGTSLNLGPIQLYAISNNALGWIKPLSANYFDIKAGMNLTFGRRKGFGY